MEELAEEINSSGGRAVGCRCDVSIYEDVKKAAELCKKQFGSIDILVNNAGLIEPIARLTGSDPESWSRVVDVNYKGVYYGLHSVIPQMVAQGSGVIVNLSSGAATSALEGWSHYCSTQGGCPFADQMCP